MAWSWSHTQEAYHAVKEQIEAKDREWLETVWAEWKTAKTDEHGCYTEETEEFDQKRYELMLKKSKKFPDDVLADEIWELTSEYATCSNGGWEAYCCPFGCLAHQIPFTPKKIEIEIETDFFDGDLGDLLEDTD